jgi:hypothetical protein
VRLMLGVLSMQGCDRWQLHSSNSRLIATRRAYMCLGYRNARRHPSLTNIHERLGLRTVRRVGVASSGFSGQRCLG